MPMARKPSVTQYRILQMISILPNVTDSYSSCSPIDHAKGQSNIDKVSGGCPGTGVKALSKVTLGVVIVVVAIIVCALDICCRRQTCRKESPNHEPPKDIKAFEDEECNPVVKGPVAM